MADFTKIGEELKKIISGETEYERGELGYTIGATFRVVDETDPKKFYVRFPSGNFVSAYHYGRVQQIPGLPVLVTVNSLGQPEIIGVDDARISAFSSSTTGATVGPHSHVRNSGMEFIIDSWLLKSMRTTVGSDLVLSVSSGMYLWNRAIKRFSGGTIDISAQQTTEFDEQAWVLIGIDPVTNSLIAVAGDSQPIATPDLSDVPLIEFVELGYIALSAICVRYDDLSLQNYRIEDLRFMPGSAVSYLRDLYDLIGMDDATYDDYLGYDGYTGFWTPMEVTGGGGGGGGGSSTFLELTDTPSSFSGQSGRHTRVNASEDAIEFVNPPMMNSGKTVLVGVPLYHREVVGSAEASITATLANLLAGAENFDQYDFIKVFLRNASTTHSAAVSGFLHYATGGAALDTTASNYRRQYVAGATSTASAAAASDALAFSISGTNVSDSRAGAEITIYNPGAGKYKFATTSNGYRQDSSVFIIRYWIHEWRNAGAIDQISVSLATGSFNIGTVVDIIGYRSEGVGGEYKGTASLIESNTTEIGNVGTGEDDLQVYAVPADLISTAGEQLRWHVAGTHIAGRIRVYLGSTALIDSGPLSGSGDWHADGIIAQLTSGSAKCSTKLVTADGSISDYVVATEDLTSDLDLLVTGEATNDDDVVSELLTVEKWNTPASSLITGWVGAGETWTYASADDPTYTLTVSGDLTDKYGAGMRVRLSQPTGGTKYFIITNVSYSSPDTTITIYGGTDYDLSNEVISSPNYSVAKFPQGFPASRSKWTVEILNTADLATAGGGVKNPGSLNIVLPIGGWLVELYALCSVSGSAADYQFSVALSTSSSSFVNPITYGYLRMSSTLTSENISFQFSDFVEVAVKTTYHLITSCSGSPTSSGVRGHLTHPTRMRAVCSYL